MQINCGLDSLAKLTNLKNVSAFTLIHLGRDNGLELQVFKVLDLADLIRVQRPAIFHQKDHFVHCKNGEVMPDGEYTGYVIGPKVLGRVVSLAESKSIKGGKNFLTGKNKDGEQTGHGALVDILAVVGSIVTANPLTGAAIEAGGSAIERAQNKDVLGSPYDPGKIAMDAVKGYAIGAGASGAAQGFTAGGGLSAGIPQAAFNAAKGALQGETQSFSHPFATSANGLSINTAAIPGSLASRAAAFGGGVSAAGIGQGAAAANAFSGASSIASGLGAASGTAGLAGASGAFSNGVSNAIGSGIGTATAPSFTPGALNSGFNLNAINFAPTSSVLPSSFSNTAPLNAGANATAAGGTQASAPTGFLGGLTKTIGNAVSSNPIGTAAGLAGGIGLLGSTPPAYNAPLPGENYSALNTFIGNTPQGAANNTLSLAATNSNTDYVNTPIQDLQKQFTANNKRTLDTINTAYDNQRQQLVHQYAQAGQNLAGSSELQDKVGQLEQKRTNDLTLAQQELQDQALGQAIQVKQQALSQGMQAGQYNSALAMQLASLTGDQQNLQYAIANNDYQSFQQIMGKLLSMGIPQSVSITNNGQTATTTKQGGV